MLSGRGAITVTFASAFIALGSDFGSGELPDSLRPFHLTAAIPGRWRWVTTSIIRFDPSEDWPAELNFELQLKDNAIGYGGATLAAPAQRAWRFATPALLMWLEGVESDGAQKLTGDRWSPEIGLHDEGPEVPPDAVVRLRFSSKVNTSMLQALRLRPRLPSHLSGEDVAYSFRKCKKPGTGASSIPIGVMPMDIGSLIAFGDAFNSDEYAVCLALGGRLAVDGLYEVALPKGSTFHAQGGLTGAEKSVRLRGLNNFSFPFITIQNGGVDSSPRPIFKRQRLWLRHGLMDGVSMEVLSKQFRLQPELPFNVSRPEKAVLLFSAAFEPEMKYTLYVDPSPRVQDGFGLPLLACKHAFRMAALDNLLLEPQTDEVTMFASSNEASVEWPILFRGERVCLRQPDVRSEVARCTGRSSRHVSLLRVTPDLVPAAIASIQSNTRVFIGAALERVVAPDDSNLTLLHMTLPLSRDLFLRTTWDGPSYSGYGVPTKKSSLLGQATLGLHFVTMPHGEMLGWLLRLRDNSPVRGAVMTLYCAAYEIATLDDVHRSAAGATDEFGVARLSTKGDVSCDGRRLWVAASAEGETPLLESVFSSFVPQPPKMVALLLTDRGVYKPTDTLLLKGYLRRQVDLELALPRSNTTAFLRVAWGNEPGQITEQPVTLHETYGSFEAEFIVPAQTLYGSVSVALFLGEHEDPTPLGGSQDGEFITSTTITIADPRPPTVTWTIAVEPQYLRPRENVSLSVSVETLSGIPVPLANVTLRWKLERGQKAYTGARGEDKVDDAAGDEQDALEGEESVSTGVTGATTITWRPHLLALGERAGDTLVLHFEYVGPTREMLTKSFRLPVAPSAERLVLELPSTTERALPTIPFKVRVDLQTLPEIGGKPIVGVPLRVALHRLHNKSGGASRLPLERLAAISTRVQACEDVLSAGRLLESCALTLPSLGYYMVSVCTLGDKAFCTTEPLGRTAQEWKAAPLTRFLDEVVDIRPDKESYRLDDSPQLAFHNPRPALRVLVIWGNLRQVKSHMTQQLEEGPVIVTMPPLGEECEGGCSVLVVMTSLGTDSHTVPAPASPLFDSALPESVERSFQLSIDTPPDRELQVSIEVDQDVAEPGSEQGFTINLKHLDGSPVTGEVCVFAVDQAFQDLQPHPIVNLSSALSPLVYLPSFSLATSYRQLASARVLNYTTAWMQRLVSADPWLLPGPEWPLRPGMSYRYGGAGPQLTFEEMLRRSAYDLTEMPGGGRSVPGLMMMRSDMMAKGPPMMAMAAPMALADMGESGQPQAISYGADAGPTAAGSGGVFLRSNFVTTPLFRTFVVQGSGRETWKLPDNTGAFELRAYAVSQSRHLFGGGVATQQLVRRPVSMSPSLPRIARVGDSFECGVTITVAPAQPQNMLLEIVLSLEGNRVLKLKPQGMDGELEVNHNSSSIVRACSPGDTFEVVFPMLATALGQQTLRVTALRSVALAGSGSDAPAAPAAAAQRVLDEVLLELPVVGAQPEVFVATSMALPACSGPCLPWEEAVELPNATEGSGHLELVVGLGHLAAVQIFAAGLLRKPDPHTAHVPSAIELLGVVGASGLLKPYADRYPQLEQWVTAQTALQDASKALNGLTTPAGLSYSLFSIPRALDTVDLYLNAFALFILRRLRLAGMPLSEELRSLEKTWRLALQGGLVQYFLNRKGHLAGELADHELLIMCRIGLGSVPPAGLASTAGVDLFSDKFIETALQQLDRLSLFSRAALLTHLLWPSHPSMDRREALVAPVKADTREHVSILALNLISSMRVTARTAYLSTSPQASHAADLRAVGLALTALSLAKQSGSVDVVPNLDKLANYVARGGGIDGGGVASLYAAYGLADYDKLSGNNGGDVDFTMLAGASPLYRASLKTTDPQPKTWQTGFGSLPLPPPPLLFEAKGMGELSVAVGIRFVPAAISSQPIYRGISVEKAVQLYDAQADAPRGLPISSAPLGAVVSVTLQLSSPDDLVGVVLEDWLPAGLEAIDPSIGGGTGYRDEEDSFFRRETLKDRVRFYSSELLAGTHTLRYRAMATTRGAFVLPPTRASTTMQPEVMGMSSGGRFHVLDISERATTVELQAPRPCAEGCSGRGACDAGSGSCQCFAGSMGRTCNETAVVPALSMRHVGAQEIEAFVLKIIGGAAEALLDVRLLTGATGEDLTAKWLFATASPWHEVAGGRLRRLGAGDLGEATASWNSTRVDSRKQTVALTLPSNVRAATTANLTVMASADGTLFGRQLLQVWIYPECIPGEEAPTCGADGRLAGGGWFHIVGFPALFAAVAAVSCTCAAVLGGARCCRPKCRFGEETLLRGAAPPDLAALDEEVELMTASNSRSGPWL